MNVFPSAVPRDSLMVRRLRQSQAANRRMAAPTLHAGRGDAYLVQQHLAYVVIGIIYAEYIELY